MAEGDQGNQTIRRNALIFAILTIVTHVIACFMYGFFIQVPSQTSSGYFAPIFIAFAHALLVVVGFGLLFSYLKKMVWTGIGFTLLITALSIEFYFMINAFWTKADVINESTTYFSSEDKTYQIYLTNTNQLTQYMATITGGFRCALAMIVAFSSILGRAGPLEAWFVVFIGTVGYELNRQIVENYTQDSGGSSSIFVFGGFMGLVLGIMKKIKDKDITNEHINYTANNFSAMMALLGTLFTWILFPILTLDYLNIGIGSHTAYTSAYTVIYSLAAATVSSFATSSMINNGFLIRDIIYGPIAGGVISSSAAFYVTNPVYGILIGMIAGIVQVAVMNLVEKKVARSKSIWNTFSFTLFGVQGMLGGVFAGAWNAVSRGLQTYGFTFTYAQTQPHQVYSWLMSLVSAAMGIGFGALAGAIILAVSRHTREDNFTDYTYWQKDDGIRLAQDEKEFDFKEGNQVKNKFSYL